MDVIRSITLSGNEQRNNIKDVNQAVLHLDRITQQNAALADQSSAAARALSSEISEVARRVSVIKTRNDNSDENDGYLAEVFR